MFAKLRFPTMCEIRFLNKDGIASEIGFEIIMALPMLQLSNARRLSHPIYLHYALKGITQTKSVWKNRSSKNDENN